MKAKFNHRNNFCVLWGRSILWRCAFAKEKCLPKFLGGGDFSKLYQVTPQTQISRPITLRHYTSWNTDCERANTLRDVK